MNIVSKKIIIATHVYTTGPAQDLRDYLIEQKIDTLLFIGHPLNYNNKLTDSGYEYYQNGKILKKYYPKIRKRPELINYFRHFYKTVKFALNSRERFDLFVGSDNLNAVAGLFLRRIGRVKKVVYYVIDYNPKRFQNRLMNKIYHKIDQFCVKRCDETWNLSKRMIQGRKKYFNFTGGKQIVVPIGIWFNRLKHKKSTTKNKTLVFMGNILKKQGVQYVIEAIPKVIKKIPNFTFLVIGGGDYIPTLKKLADNIGVSKYVKFTDFIDDHKEVEKMLSRCSVAVAMYEKFDENGDLSFTYFADPGKIKSYLASGLPVLLTDVPHNAKEIEKLNCGKIIKTDYKDIVRAVVSLMKDENKLMKYRQNAIKYAEKYDWNLIFEKNLKRVLS